MRKGAGPLCWKGRRGILDRPFCCGIGGRFRQGFRRNVLACRGLCTLGEGFIFSLFVEGFDGGVKVGDGGLEEVISLDEVEDVECAKV